VSDGFDRVRVRAVARHDLRILRRDPAFLVIFTVTPLAFMAFNTAAFGAALEARFPGQDINGAAFVVPGATVLFSGFLVGNLGFGIFREHGWGTWERLRSSMLSPAELMVGKSLVPILTIGIQLTVLLGGGSLLFGLELRGSLVAFLLVAVMLAVMEIALGFMLLSICRSVMQLNALTNAGAMLISGLGGAVTPIEFLPGWAQAIAPATPAYWAMRGFRSVTIESGGLAEVALPIAVLAAFSVAFLVVAVVRFEVEDTKVSWA
jgi:ABC-2 type transport system permease protein